MSHLRRYAQAEENARHGHLSQLVYMLTRGCHEVGYMSTNRVPAGEAEPRDQADPVREARQVAGLVPRVCIEPSVQHLDVQRLREMAEVPALSKPVGHR